MEKPVVLIIDDQEQVLKLVGHLFELEGYHVLTASSGPKALSIVEEHAVDIILLDLRLSEMDGVMIFQRLRELPQTADVPIIILSAISDVETRATLLEMGADDFVVKPFSSDDLIARAAMHHRLYKLQQEKQQAKADAALNAHYLQVVNEIGQLANQNLYSQQEMLQAVASRLVEAFELQRCSMWLNDAGGWKRVATAVVDTAPDITIDLSIPQQIELVLGVTHSQIPLASNLLQLGVMHLTHATPIRPQQILALRTLATQLSMAITNASLLTDLHQHNQELEALILTNQQLLQQEQEGRAQAMMMANENAQLYAEQAKLVEELKMSQAQLIQSEKTAATGRLAAALAHEINNPIQAVHSALQLLTQFELTEAKQKEFLQMACDDAERLIKLTGQILEFVHPSPDNYKPVLLSDLLDDVFLLCHKQFKRQQITLQREMAPTPLSLQVIPDQIKQVFLSIMLNALDAMPHTGLLTITTHVDDAYVTIVFKDTGVGMSSEVLEMAFEPFFSTKTASAGLGLTVSYNIMTQHEGTIALNSVCGEGTMVAVTLPMPDITGVNS